MILLDSIITNLGWVGSYGVRESLYGTVKARRLKRSCSESTSHTKRHNRGNDENQFHHGDKEETYNPGYYELEEGSMWKICVSRIISKEQIAFFSTSAKCSFTVVCSHLSHQTRSHFVVASMIARADWGNPTGHSRVVRRRPLAGVNIF